LITSFSNESIKTIRKLRVRKYRDATGTAYVEGVRQVVEALQQGVMIDKLILSEDFLRTLNDESIKNLVEKSNTTLLTVSNEVFRSFSLKEGPKGIVAIIYQKWVQLSEICNLHGIWVCLWEIADPGNLGTIIRTMDAVGAKGVILVGNCTDPYDPVAIRASMGGIFTKTLVKSSLTELIAAVEHHKIPIFGTSDSGGLYYRDVNYPENMILVMGSERQGIPQEISKLCNAMVGLPMTGVCDSLNLAVATGVILYEIFDQHNILTGNKIK